MTVGTGAVAFGSPGMQYVGSHSVNTDAEYLDPKGKIKKKKANKENFSQFVDEKDAKKNHIKGEMNQKGQAKGQVKESVNKPVVLRKIEARLRRLGIDG